MLFSLAPFYAAAQQWYELSFRADAPGIDENPLRGFVPYSDRRQALAAFPHSLEWFYLPLSDVITGPDTYDWAALEHQLSNVAQRGHQAAFRFYVDFPGKPSGIPHYLLDEGLKTFPYEDANNTRSPTPSVAPDYSNPQLIDCMVRFIHALGTKYDGDVRIAYIEAGLYGFWGEWHVHQHPLPGEPRGWAIAQRDKDALLRAYTESFHKTLLLVRYPYVTDRRDLLVHFGFHDDSFLQDTIGLKRSQFWPAVEQAGEGDSWKSRPIGGEVRPELQATVWDSWPNSEGQDVRQAIKATHATWMLDAGLFKTPPTPAEYANALRAERMLGYTFFCSAVRMTRGPNDLATVTLRVENRGVAPFYYAWPAELEALDAKGKIIGQTQTLWPLPTLLPGKKAEWSASLGVPAQGIARVLVRIANPMSGGNPIAFANAEMGTVQPGWLTLDVRGN